MSQPTLREIIHQRCLQEYHNIVSKNPKIDAGHSVNHVIKVEQWTSRAFQEYKLMRFECSVEDFHGWSKDSLQIGPDTAIRIMAASDLHEVGDGKFSDGSVKPKEELLSEVLDRVFFDYSNYNEEMKQDIINMIKWCGARDWGNRIPEGAKLYQLIPRWADRLEATGPIGVIRTMTYSYVKRATYPLCRDEDEFPTTMEELEKFAPPERFIAYSTGKLPPLSGFGHYLDKIVHINGNDVLIPCLRLALDEGQAFVKQFVLDFTNKHGKKFDIDWILTQIDHQIYNVEVKQLKEMQQVLRSEGCKWIK